MSLELGMRHLRDHPRVKIQLESLFLLEGNEDWHQGIIRNLSPSGAAMLVSDVLPTGAYLECLRFVLPGEEASEEEIIEVEALVVGREHETRVGPRWNYLIRLKFVNMATDRFEQVQNFVAARLSADGPPIKAQPPPNHRVQVEQPVVVKFDRLGDFEKMAACNLSQTGMFLAAERPKPPGSILDFEFQLGDDLALVRGRGEVVWTRREGQGENQPAGMGVRFFRMDETGKDVIRRIVEEGGHQTPQAFNFERQPESAEPTDVEIAASPAGDPSDERSVRLVQRIQQLEESLDESQQARERLLGRLGEANQRIRALARQVEALETTCRDLRLELHQVHTKTAKPSRTPKPIDWDTFEQPAKNGPEKSDRSH